MADLAKCQCRRFDEERMACTTLATQEDLLCDECRDGCGVAVGFDTGKCRHFAMTFTEFRWHLDRVR